MPLKCKICHGNGSNEADDASCLNCGGTGEEQKYSLKDFCIEFKDAVNSDPEMMSGLRQLIDSTHQATVEEIIKIAEGMKRQHYFEQQPFLKHRNDFNDAYNEVIDDLIKAIKK